jgi:hypothetical protein
VLREQLGKRIHLTDPERRRLARLGKAVGRKALGQLASIASPDTILRWCRESVTRKCDGSNNRERDNGRLEAGERCDLGALNGLDDTQCRRDCTDCGDSIVDPGESCDLGPLNGSP